MSDKNSCYNCKFRRRIPGNTHIKCVHPVFDEVHKDPLGELISIMGGGMSIEDIVMASIIMGFKPNAHGVRKGWFSFPFNYDPTWIDGECQKHESSNNA